MVSPTNAMLAKGADSIIILAPIADGLGMMPGAFDDAKLLSEHSHVLVISQIVRVELKLEITFIIPITY